MIRAETKNCLKFIKLFDTSIKYDFKFCIIKVFRKIDKIFIWAYLFKTIKFTLMLNLVQPI